MIEFLTVIFVALIIVVPVIFISHRQQFRKRFEYFVSEKPKLIKRSGKHSTIYFLLDKSNGTVKFGRAVNFDRRFKTHLTSNRDLRVIRTFPETETFNETLIKRKFGQDEWVPFSNELKQTIATGRIKWE